MVKQTRQLVASSRSRQLPVCCELFVHELAPRLPYRTFETGHHTSGGKFRHRDGKPADAHLWCGLPELLVKGLVEAAGATEDPSRFRKQKILAGQLQLGDNSFAKRSQFPCGATKQLPRRS